MAESDVVNDSPKGNTEIVIRPPGVVDVASQELQSYLGSKLTVEIEEDPEEIERQIIGQILSAETVDEVLASGTTTPARDILERPIVMGDVKFLNSEYEQGAPFFAVIDAVDVQTGERLPVSCGGKKVLAQLLKCKSHGWFPQKVVFRQSARPTKAGYFPLRLEKL